MMAGELEREIVQRLRQDYTVPEIVDELECHESTVRRVMWQEKRKALPIAARQSSKADRDVAFIRRGIERRRREIQMLEQNLLHITSGNATK